MSSVVISGDTSGAITLAAPAVSGTNTATLPAATGTVMVSGAMPAFSVWCSTSPSIAANTFVKVPFDTKTFDTNNCFDNATNYRFTPTFAGYYQINGRVGLASSTGVVDCYCNIYKNGTRYKRGSDGGTAITTNIADVVYLNGSTDYVELYIYQYNGPSITLDGGEAQRVYFSGSMVRGA